MQESLLEPPSGRLSGWTPDAWPVASGWTAVTEPFFAGPAGQRLAAFIGSRLAVGAAVYPPTPLRALSLTPLDAVRVVILGQDPYHGPGQADGLAFSVRAGVRVPPSLRNILAEARSAGAAAPTDGSLERWAAQGVLLLNTCLSVEDGAPASHAGQGWEALTDALITAVARNRRGVVFMLWGAHAQAKQGLLAGTDHPVLLANHPSPLSARRPPRPFLGCGHFRAANELLTQRGGSPIRW